MKDFGPAAILLAAFCAMWWNLDTKMERMEIQLEARIDTLEDRMDRLETLLKDRFTALTDRADRLGRSYIALRNEYSQHVHR